MRWGLFQMAEYVNMITLSALAVTLFFGGWHGPWAPLGPLWFLLKLLVDRLRLHLDAGDAAAAALRPADALRLEGAAAGGDDQRASSPRRWWWRSVSRSRSTRSRASASRSSRSSRSRSRSSTRSTSGRSTRASAAGTGSGRHENGLEKCVGCSLCAAACPADCIRVVAAENTADNRVSAGERYARIYEINLSRCIFCGYCELACPFDAITLGNEFEISEYSRDDLIYTKDMLLRRADQAGAGRRPRPLRHADPVLQGALVIVRRRGNVLVWVVWVVAAFACLGSGIAVVTLLEPVLLGARADREPRLARGALPAALGRVRRRGAGARLRGRGDGDVPVRDRLPRRAGRRAVGRRAELADASARSRRPARCSSRSIVVIGLKAGGRLSHHGEHRDAVRQPGEIGRLFLTDHLLAFEITSIVLLVAAVGGVVLGAHARGASDDRRRRGSDGPGRRLVPRRRRRSCSRPARSAC